MTTDILYFFDKNLQALNNFYINWYLSAKERARKIYLVEDIARLDVVQQTWRELKYFHPEYIEYKTLLKYIQTIIKIYFVSVLAALFVLGLDNALLLGFSLALIFLGIFLGDLWEGNFDYLITVKTAYVYADYIRELVAVFRKKNRYTYLLKKKTPLSYENILKIGVNFEHKELRIYDFFGLVMRLRNWLVKVNTALTPYIDFGLRQAQNYALALLVWFVVEKYLLFEKNIKI